MSTFHEIFTLRCASGSNLLSEFRRSSYKDISYPLFSREFSLLLFQPSFFYTTSLCIKISCVAMFCQVNSNRSLNHFSCHRDALIAFYFSIDQMVFFVQLCTTQSLNRQFRLEIYIWDLHIARILNAAISKTQNSFCFQQVYSDLALI